MEKKTSFIFLLVLLSWTLMIGQDDSSWPTKGDTEIGIVFGLNVADYYGPDIDSDDTDYRIGILGGASIDYYFSDKWSLKAILNYDQKGVKDPFTDLTIAADYITIPINANWHFGKRKRWFLNFGPYAGFLLSAKISGISVKDELESFDFGFNTNIGIKIPLSENLMFFIESSGQSGFVNVAVDSEAKNSRGTLAIGVFF